MQQLNTAYKLTNTTSSTKCYSISLQVETPSFVSTYCPLLWYVVTKTPHVRFFTHLLIFGVG
jgi:hypothetical protein